MLSGVLQAIRGYRPPGGGADCVAQRREAEGDGDGSAATSPCEMSSGNLMSRRAGGRIQPLQHPSLGVALMFFPYLVYVTTFELA